LPSGCQAAAGAPWNADIAVVMVTWTSPPSSVICAKAVVAQHQAVATTATAEHIPPELADP
jgi:hypothetical protein